MPGLNRPSTAGTRSLTLMRKQSYPDSSDGEDEPMTIPQDSDRPEALEAGEEVELFARWLDECLMHSGTLAETGSHALKLVDDYYELAQKKANTLRERRRLEMLAKRGLRGNAETPLDAVARDYNNLDISDKQDPRANELRTWQSEAQTWDLLRKILPLRYPESAPKPRARPQSTNARSRKHYWDDFISADNAIAERKVVLDWLQSNACDGPEVDELLEEYQDKADRGDIVAHGWLHTRSAIKLHKSVNAISRELEPKSSDLSEFKYVTQLDPDAMTRQDRKLESHDEQFEKATWLGCFHLLRRGKSMKDMRDWCSERTEIWRAAAASAIPMSFSDDDDGADFDVSAAILWRRICYALVKQSGTEAYEKAFYGLLSGDLASVMALGKTWDDYIFAHYNALLRTQFDTYLIKQAGGSLPQTSLSLPTFDAVQFLGDNTTLGKRLVSALETDTSCPELARKQAATSAKALQGAIIGNTLDRYVFQQGKAISIEANEDKESRLIPLDTTGPSKPDGPATRYVKMADQSGLRLITHILIVLSMFEERTSNRDASAMGAFGSRDVIKENILVAYVSYLRNANLEELIPVYCSRLSGERRYEVLSENVVHVPDVHYQVALLQLMSKVGLDINAFLKVHPMHFFRQLQESDTTPLPKESIKLLRDKSLHARYGRGIKKGFLKDNDEIQLLQTRVIQAMAWFKLTEGLLLEACEYGVKIYEYFLLRQDLTAVRAFADSFSVAKLVYKKTGQALPDDTTLDALRSFFEVQEDEDHAADVDAARDPELLAMAVWNLMEMEALVRSIDAMDTVANCTEWEREQDGSKEINKETKNFVVKAMDSARVHMPLVMNEWMLDTPKENDNINVLREMYIPEIILTYISALHFCGMCLSRDFFPEALDLATVIAAKDSDLAPLFTSTGRMTELVESFAAVSKALVFRNERVARQIARDGKSKEKANAGGKMLTKMAKERGWNKDLFDVKS